MTTFLEREDERKFWILFYYILTLNKYNLIKIIINKNTYVFFFFLFFINLLSSLHNPVNKNKKCRDILSHLKQLMEWAEHYGDLVSDVLIHNLNISYWERVFCFNHNNYYIGK